MNQLYLFGYIALTGLGAVLRYYNPSVVVHYTLGFYNLIPKLIQEHTEGFKLLEGGTILLAYFFALYLNGGSILMALMVAVTFGLHKLAFITGRHQAMNNLREAARQGLLEGYSFERLKRVTGTQDAFHLTDAQILSVYEILKTEADF